MAAGLPWALPVDNRSFTQQQEDGDNLVQGMVALPSLLTGGGALIQGGRWLVGRAAAGAVTRAAQPAIERVVAGQVQRVEGSLVGESVGILRDAARLKGNYGLGQASNAEAQALGQSWVGPNYRLASDGKTLVSRDGLRTYRPPSRKNSPYATTGIQANFERLEIVNGRPAVIGNGHLNITP